jgi:hypothetical protein
MFRSPTAPRARRGALLFAAAGWVIFAQTMVRLSGRPLPQQRRALARLAGALPPLSGYTVREAASAMTSVARRVPGARCLIWSLALHGLLAQMGMPSDVQIGVASDERSGLTAHAWVVCQGAAWSWGDGDVSAYNVLRPRAAFR